MAYNDNPSYLKLSGGTMTGNLILNADPSTALGASTKQYVDNAIAAVNPATSVVAATTANLNATYLNGVSGIGASLTNAGTLAAFTIDGQTPTLGQRVLVKNQSSTFQNGVYTVSTLGTGAIAWILTRAIDYDQPSDINNTGVINVLNGTANALTGWLINSTVTTVGTDAITYVQYNNAPISVTQFDVLVGGASNAIVSVGPGSVGQVLQSGGNASNPAYSTATFPLTTTLNQILYSSAANTVSEVTAVNQAVLTTGTTGIPTLTSIATNGQIIIGSTAGAPAAGLITGTAIAVTNGSNTIALAVTGGGLTWNNVTGATQTLFSRNGYIANRATIVTFTMNASNLGDVFRIVGIGAGGWILNPTGSQIFQLGNVSSTVTTGSLASTQANDCIEIVALSSTQLIVMSAMGNITIV